MKRYARMIYMLSQCKDAIDNPCGAIRVNENQSGACSSSDMITSGGRKSKKTMEDKLIVVVCGYPELYDTTSYFYKNRNTFCNETGAAWQNLKYHCLYFHS